MSRRRSMTRWDVAVKVARSLREFGYDNLETKEVAEVLDAWIDGKRDHDLPRGVIGLMAGRQFDEVDEARPGVLASLPKGTPDE
jgi:hypothetical protein